MCADSLLRDNLTLAVQSFYTAKDAERCTPKTLDAYTRALDKFILYLRAQAISDPTQITPAIVRAYFAELGKRDYTAHTVHDYARPVKTFVRFLYADDILTTDVMARVKMPKLDKPILPAFTQADISKILAACDCERDKAICLFMLDTGVRASELCSLKVGDFDIATGATMVKRGKGGKGRTVYCGSKSRRAVLRYLLSRNNPAESEPLFPSLRDGKPLQPNGLLLMFRRIGARSGVQEVHPHTFRRSFALMSLRAGMDLIRLAALMGHSDLTVLRQYLDLAEADLQDAHRQHGPQF